jgi:RNA polymerase sigma factor (sigma-70 family)
VNNDTTTEKLPLDALLNQDLHDMINSLASQFYGVHGKRNIHSVMISQEDLALEGYVGATIAYRSFDPDLGHTDDVAQSFRTHAYPYIKNAMLTYCRKFGHSLSISEKAARDDLGAIINIGVIHIDQFDEDKEFDIPIGSGVEISQDVDEYFLAGFTEFERNLVKDHMIDGYSLQELSDKYGVSKSRAGEIIRKLTDRMRIRAENYVKDN